MAEPVDLNLKSEKNVSEPRTCPGELGDVSRDRKVVKELITNVRANPDADDAEQAVGRAAVADDTAPRACLYGRAQSVMGGTSQLQRNLAARRVMGLPA